MCNLYSVRKSAAEVAAHFNVATPVLSNAADEIYPGAPGLVVREVQGARILQSMTWGFPLRLASMAPTSKPKTVNNVGDYTRPMWKSVLARPEQHCLIPLSAFAEAEGTKGTKTRTWFRVVDQPLFAWAGVWRDSAEWGPVYSGLMTNCNAAIQPVHDRMPVLLHAEEWDHWLHGGFAEAVSLRERCFPDAQIAIERTPEPWAKRKVGIEQAALL